MTGPPAPLLPPEARAAGRLASSGGPEGRPRVGLDGIHTNCAESPRWDWDCQWAHRGDLRIVSTADEDEDLLFKCWSWDCRSCGPIMKYRFIEGVAEAFKDTKVGFWTLTLPGGARRPSPHESFAAMEQVYRTFRVLIRRANERCWRHRWGKRAGYRCKGCQEARKSPRRPKIVRVRERHKDGVAHMHVVADIHVPRSWLETAWAKAGGGFVNVKGADPHRLGAYISKYLAKEAEALPVKGRSRDGRRIRWHKYDSTTNIKLGVRPQGNGTWAVALANDLGDSEPVQGDVVRLVVAAMMSPMRGRGPPWRGLKATWAGVAA